VKRLGPALAVSLLRIGRLAAVVGSRHGAVRPRRPGACRLIVPMRHAGRRAQLSLALRWDNAPKRWAGTVVLSTFASILTVPLLRICC